MKLAELMRDKGISDAELAKQMGCMQSTVFQWKGGGFSPKANKVVKLCTLLQCSADELLGIATYSTPLRTYQGQRLYNAITDKGAFDSNSIHQLASQFRQFAGKTTSLETWLRKIAEALYDIELVSQESESLSSPSWETQERLAESVSVPTPVNPLDREKPVRRLDQKRRKKAKAGRVLAS